MQVRRLSEAPPALYLTPNQVVIDALEMLGLEVPADLDPHIKFILGLASTPL